MSNPWYARYPGDYARDTAHLSLVEHGAYTLLLDHYYSTSAALPADITALYRICRAFDETERKAVDSILRQFFNLQSNTYHNSRADMEIVRRTEQHERLSSSGRRGAEKRWKDGQAISQAIGQVVASPQPQPQPKEEKKRTAQAAPSLSFAGQHFSVTERQDALLGEAFPWVDRPAEYRKADSWMEANPDKRPKKANRFLHNWFSRVSQPKGGANGKDINEAVATTMRGFAVNNGITH